MSNKSRHNKASRILQALNNNAFKGWTIEGIAKESDIKRDVVVNILRTTPRD